MNQSIWADPPAPAPASALEQQPKAKTHDHNSIALRQADSQQAFAAPPESTTSSLSAAATTFSPDTSAPPPDVASAEIFAQTGAQQDDLFDDIVPADESMRIRSEDDLFSEDFTPVPEPVVEQPPPQQSAKRASPDASRGRGRGLVRARGGQDARGGQSRREARHVQDVRTEESARAQPQESLAPNNAPNGPRKEGPTSVRGDRFATGGVRKPKLTEEELAEKMAKIQIKNASLTAAHARAEADAASFAEREQQAKQVSAQRQKEERRDRQQMMGEREKNRLRKLKAMEGREWDAEKNDADFARGGRFDKKGGFAGDQQDYSDGREYLYREPRGGDRGRGGPKGSRGGRPQEPTAPPKTEDFPELPTTKTKVDATLDSSSKPTGKSWADQVEAS